MEGIDAARIYLAGFGLGGKVALWTAAMDQRPAAVVSVAGFTPLRSAPAGTTSALGKSNPLALA